MVLYFVTNWIKFYLVFYSYPHLSFMITNLSVCVCMRVWLHFERSIWKHGERREKTEAQMKRENCFEPKRRQRQKTNEKSWDVKLKYISTLEPGTNKKKRKTQRRKTLPAPRVAARMKKDAAGWSTSAIIIIISGDESRNFNNNRSFGLTNQENSSLARSQWM